ncbi:hypothetical protein [Mycobacterium intracellulare]|uniref:hypothetical protein n=1 Tax=Mycobacterium intracellulare TaxID=1767 RepID=UPI001EEDA8D6|nr:hypothetical protein [Mycobacterium intracellulare]MEE3755356.1 hypothetical protein [Mycobacterium intracellulare]
MWSGAGLLVALVVGRYAIAQGLSRPRFAVAWSVSAACAHSLTNMHDLGGALLLLLATALVMAACAVEMSMRGPRSRNMLWWLATADSAPKQADPERETIG